MKRAILAALALICVATPAQAQKPKPAKPNILIISGDDIGVTNVSAYSSGLMGYRTPNIDRVAAPNMVERLKNGHQAVGKTFKVHVDGYNLLPYLTGQEPKSPRKGFI